MESQRERKREGGGREEGGEEEAGTKGSPRTSQASWEAPRERKEGREGEAEAARRKRSSM